MGDTSDDDARAAISVPCSTTPHRRQRGSLHRARKSGASERQRATFTAANSAIIRVKARAGSCRFSNSEILVCRQCENEQHARRVAEMAKATYLRQDCLALEKGGA